MKAIASVRITNDRLELNGNPLFQQINLGGDKVPFKLLYDELEIKYSKFHKMDNLSKLGFLGVEMLKKTVSFDTYAPGRIAQIFQNSYSSLDTDVVHQQSINEKKMPSPAVFVYTLPNIVMGEIAIRNELYGENLFTLVDNFLPEKWLELVNLQFKIGKADAVVGGWIEIFKNKFDLRLYFIDIAKNKEGFKVI